MPEVQTYKNHVRLDPVWHYILIPFFLINVVFPITFAIEHWPQHRVLSCWYILLSIALLLAVGRARQHCLIAQDRVIRLEEKLRFLGILPPELLARSSALTLRQIIGLRFAADAELPALVERTLNEHLSEKQIKEAIATWRPDTYRV